MKLKRAVKLYLLRLFRLKSKTQNISLGFTLGFLPNWLPTFGFGPVLSLAIARVFKVNIVSAFIGGVSGMFLWPFLFYMNYLVGDKVFNIFNLIPSIDEQGIESIHLFYYKTLNIGIEFLVGALINIITSSIVLYFVVYLIFSKYRTFYLRRIKKW